MTLTKAQIRTQIQQTLDDASATMYSATNLDILTGLVIDELWTDILDFAPWYTSALDTITTGPKLVSPGYVDLTQLAQRFHRLQHVVRNNMVYRGQHPLDTLVVANTALVGSDFTYRLYGNQLWLLPLSMSATEPIELRYSYKPPLFTGLADGTAITWPDGHEAAIIYKTATRAMTKGAREDNSVLRQEANEAYDRLISAVRRREIGPIQPYTTTTTVEHGGI
jgi:hypothetical protein